MACVLGVLSDHSQHQPTQCVGAITRDDTHLLQPCCGVNDLAGSLTLCPPDRDCFQGVTVERFEVLVGLALPLGATRLIRRGGWRRGSPSAREYAARAIVRTGSTNEPLADRRVSRTCPSSSTRRARRAAPP